MIPAGSKDSRARHKDDFTPPRDAVFPVRFHELGGAGALVELWDLRQAARPEALVCSVAALAQRLATEPSLPPAAFIFHCSRCGSTLLARLFAAAAGNRVFDEPGAFHHFRDARWDRLGEPASLHALQTLIAAHGLGPVPGEARLVIKFDSRAVMAIGALRQCFPTVPFIYLLRDPVEVVASLNAAPPGFLGRENRARLAETLGDPAAAAAGYSDVEWYAWYVERNLRIALEQAAYFSAVIDYRFFATRYLETVNRLSGGELRWEDPAIQDRVSRHSKDPATPFRGGASAVLPTREVREAVARMVGDTFSAWSILTDPRASPSAS